MMKLLDDYFALQKQIYDHFRYSEEWRVFPLDDCREYFWSLDGANVRYAEDLEKLSDDLAGDYYSNEIYNGGAHGARIFRGQDYTMVCVDTHTDGNQFLQVFDNAKEVK